MSAVAWTWPEMLLALCKISWQVKQAWPSQKLENIWRGWRWARKMHLDSLVSIFIWTALWPVNSCHHLLFIYLFLAGWEEIPWRHFWSLMAEICCITWRKNALLTTVIQMCFHCVYSWTVLNWCKYNFSVSVWTNGRINYTCTLIVWWAKLCDLKCSILRGKYMALFYWAHFFCFYFISESYFWHFLMPSMYCMTFETCRLNCSKQ